MSTTLEVWRTRFRALDQNYAPLDVPVSRWRDFLRDVSDFIASGDADTALGLGWDELELLAANRISPWARIDQAGILWLVRRRSMIAIEADVIALDDGTTCRRRPVDPDAVTMPWELIL